MRFKCPKCGGIHFWSEQKGRENPHDRIYICRGTEHGPNGTELGLPYQPPCGWRGEKTECIFEGDIDADSNE